MQGPSWIALFERIPTNLHDTLALTLVTGAEILMQSILRLETDLVIMRGRMSGSTDAGRVLILPYDQIVNLAFTKRMLEPEVKAVFGELMEAPAQLTDKNNVENGASETEPAAKEVKAADNKPGPERAPAANATPPKPAPPTATPAAAPLKNPPPAPSKTMLLARLRARLAEQGK